MSKSKKISLIFAIITVVLIAVIVVSQIMMNNTSTAYTNTTYAMGTYVDQTIYGTDAETASENGAQAVQKLESLISWKLEDSDIYKINANAGKDWTEVSTTTENILNQAIEVSKASSGAFDFTILPLTSLWNFDNSPTTPPSDDDIQKSKQYIDYSALRYDPDNSSYSFKSAGYAIDLSGIGNGAACDVAIAEYRALDIDRALVSIGGSIGVYSTNDHVWTIGIEEDGETLGKVKITSGYCSTSGSANKCFEYEGKTYHHILDPETGYPTETDLSSVTVFCDSGAISDALATACFNLGYDDSLDVLSQFDAQAVFVYKDKTVKVTDGLDYITA